MWTYARDAVPNHIEHWLESANAERWTEMKLRPLEGVVTSHTPTPDDQLLAVELAHLDRFRVIDEPPRPSF